MRGKPPHRRTRDAVPGGGAVSKGPDCCASGGGHSALLRPPCAFLALPEWAPPVQLRRSRLASVASSAAAQTP
ncbi:MAG: hypothetical protein AW07_03305 [Candidatus Accumulibacter sp. SK-11]|nr:MAG: hypothetical protein AW07_03305 [Candidatus Accumulibacter sp. SK-11]